MSGPRYFERIETIALAEFFECARRGTPSERLAAVDIADHFGHTAEREEFTARCLVDVVDLADMGAWDGSAQ